MKNEVIKTVLHLTDDKGWIKEEELEGDWCGHVWRIRKYASCATEVLVCDDSEPVDEKFDRGDIEFLAVRISYERIAKNYYLKRVYLEQER